MVQRSMKRASSTSASRMTGILLLLFLVFSHGVEVLAEGVEGALPRLDVLAHPLVGFGHGLRPESVDALLGPLLVSTQAGVPQDPEVLRDSGAGHREAGGDVAGGELSLGQELDDLATGRI